MDEGRGWKVEVEVEDIRMRSRWFYLSGGRWQVTAELRMLKSRVPGTNRYEYTRVLITNDWIARHKHCLFKKPFTKFFLKM